MTYYEQNPNSRTGKGAKLQLAMRSLQTASHLAHQSRTIAIASDFLPPPPELPESRGERLLLHGEPNLLPIFREISCPTFPGTWRTKISAKNFANFSPHFLPMSAKNFARISLSVLFGITISALTNPNRQRSRKKKRFRLRNRCSKSQITSDFPSHP